MKNVRRISNKLADKHRQKEQMVIPGTDTELSLAADDYVLARDKYNKSRDELKDDRECLDLAGERCAEIMIKQGLEKCRHSGITLYVSKPKEKKAKIVAKEE